MAQRRADRVPRRNLPKADTAIQTAGHEGLAVGAKGRRKDDSGMNQRPTEALSGLHIPQTGPIFLGCGCHQPTVRAVSRGIQVILAGEHTPHVLPRVNVVALEKTLELARHQEGLAVRD